MMKVDRYIFAVLVMFSFLIFCCDNSSDTLEEGTFKVNIDGYVEKTFTGSAIFEEIPYYDNSYFFLELRETDLPVDENCYIQFSGTKLERGTFELLNNESDESSQGKPIGIYAASENSRDYFSIGGEIKVTYSTESELIGYFDFPAVGYIYNSEGEPQRVEIRISGEFHAIAGDTGIIIG